MSKRPLINTRDEPHADPDRFRRLHIVGNDSLYSPWAKWLRLGTYEMAVTMAETSIETSKELTQYLPELPNRSSYMARRAVLAFSVGHPTQKTIVARNGKKYSAANYLEIFRDKAHELVDRGTISVRHDDRERALVVDEVDNAIDLVRDPDESKLNCLVDSSTRHELHEEILSKKPISTSQLHVIDTLLDDSERRFDIAARYQTQATEKSTERLCEVYGITPEHFNQLCDRYMVEPYPGRAVRRGEMVKEGAYVQWEKWRHDDELHAHNDLDPYVDAKVFPFWEAA